MKQFLFSKSVLMGAALVAGTAMFTACSSDEVVQENVNPTYNGESVKTQFAINIPAAGKNTRLAQDIVQGQDAPKFRGMTNIRLVPFAETTIEGTTTTSIKPIALGAIGSTELQTNGSYKVYNDVDIPVGVNSFLFYSEATEAQGSTGSLINGSIIPSYEVSGWPLNQQVDQIQFNLEPIIGEKTVITSQEALAQMLTDIAGVSGTTGTNTAWSAATGDLKNLYDNFITLKAGSANSIKAALQELYNSVKDDKVDDVDELKNAIATKITETYFEAEGPTDGKYTLSWKSSVADDIKTFPNNLGLPDGSQQLTFATNKFSYVAPTSGTDGNILQQTAYNKYVYPASLFYTVNTPIRVSDETKASNGSYPGTDWDNILQTNYGADNGTVSSTTQSIALVSPIQYAVASLNLFVRFANDYIYDNGDNWPSSQDAVGKIAVPITGEGFPLNGILIGGQKPVKWDFTTTETEDNAAWTIYDASTGSAAVKKSDAYLDDPTAYTLALETKGVTSGAAQGETVRFALEMTNASGSDFIGKDGIVPAGGKFYLVGNLVSETQAGGALKVFEQDHKTIAKVTITSLKSAYNCIPDLRSPKLELGLSVDLEWQEGLEYEVTID